MNGRHTGGSLFNEVERLRSERSERRNTRLVLSQDGYPNNPTPVSYVVPSETVRQSVYFHELLLN